MCSGQTITTLTRLAAAVCDETLTVKVVSSHGSVESQVVVPTIGGGMFGTKNGPAE